MDITIHISDDDAKAIKKAHEQYLHGQTDDEYHAYVYTQELISNSLDVSHEITQAVLMHYDLPDDPEE